MRSYFLKIRFLTMLMGLTAVFFASAVALSAQEKRNIATTESSSRRDFKGGTGESTDDDVSGPVASSGGPVEDAQPPKNHDPSEYVPSLTGNQVFFVDSIPEFSPLYGATLSQPVSGNSLTYASPYVGFSAATSRTKFVFQYSPTIMRRWNATPRTAAYQAGSIFLHRELSRKWRLALNVDTRYGDNGVRLLGTPSFGVTGDIPSVNPNSFVVEPAIHELLTNNVTLDLSWQPTVRRQIVFSSQELFREAIGPQSGRANLLGFQMSWREGLTHRLKLIATGRVRRIYEATPCDSYGGRLGLMLTTARGIVVEVGGGPEFATGGTCQTRQGLTTEASLSVPFGRDSRLFLSYDRSLNDLFVSPRVQSRDFLGLGYQKLLPHNIDLHFESGYYRIRQCCGFSSTQGYYFSPLVGWGFSLSRNTSLQVNYRSFFRQVDQLGIDRNQLIVSLQWKPTLRGVKANN